MQHTLVRYRVWLLAVACGVAVIVVWLALASANTAVEAASPIESDPALPASVYCDEHKPVYGSPISCVGSGGTALVWPDGVVTELRSSHSPVFVGTGEVQVVGPTGAEIASTSINISPDIGLNCDVWGDEIKKVFELEKTELRSQGWDYVFIDVESGDTVHPGDPAHPSGGSEDGLERIVLDEVHATAMCRITSRAAEDLDGSYSLIVESPWEAPQSTSIKIIGPTSSTRWAGAQPGELTAVVTVGNVTASERAQVYQSGCS